ncbi:MAG: hypothetical protein KKA19_00835 [Candidatus Margulisbacteria bacterium]|nr:hypothetical protein [Candidatus Margulisiibacteriota bacterium]
MNLFEKNRKHVKNFLRYFLLWKQEKAYRQKLRGLSRAALKVSRKDLPGQMDFWNSPQEKMKLLEGLLI